MLVMYMDPGSSTCLKKMRHPTALSPMEDEVKSFVKR